MLFGSDTGCLCTLYHRWLTILLFLCTIEVGIGFSYRWNFWLSERSLFSDSHTNIMVAILYFYKVFVYFDALYFMFNCGWSILLFFLVYYFFQCCADCTMFYLWYIVLHVGCFFFWVGWHRRIPEYRRARHILGITELLYWSQLKGYMRDPNTYAFHPKMGLNHRRISIFII